MQLTLLIPDLILPRRSQGPIDALLDVYRELRLPSLEYMLGRMSSLPLPAMPLENWLCDAFGVAPNPDLPMGALSLLAEQGEPGDAYWLRVDPVHLEPQRDQLVLVDGEQLAIGRTEAEQLIAALNEHFAVTGETFHAIDPRRWYARMNKPLEIITRPLSAVAGRGISTRMATGYHASKLSQFMTEAQMLLHSHPVNQTREAQGQPTINSIWPWGGGRLPAIVERPFSHIWSSNPVAQGLARASRSVYSDLPAHAGAVIQEDGGGHSLVVLDMLHSPAAYGNYAGWQKAMRSLEEKWMKPLAHAHRRGQITRLTLYAMNYQQTLQFTLERSARWQVWRRPSPLARYINAA